MYKLSQLIITYVKVKIFILFYKKKLKTKQKTSNFLVISTVYSYLPRLLI